MQGHFPVTSLTDFEAMLRYGPLSDEAPEFEVVRNDLEHRGRGAHTLDRHGPDIALRRTAGEKTIEGRVHGDPPWRRRVTRSYQWIDLPTIDHTVNSYVRRHWAVIRLDLAHRHRHEGVANAGRVVGRGYDHSGSPGTGPARYREISRFKVCLRLALDAVPAVPFVVSAFPWSRPVGGYRR
jgi:hypothetical protein